jgi:hypothetical protein
MRLQPLIVEGPIEQVTLQTDVPAIKDGRAEVAADYTTVFALFEFLGATPLGTSRASERMTPWADVEIAPN